MILTTKWDAGQMLYLKTDTDQKPRILTGFNFKVGSVLYELSCGTGSSWHQDFEISEDVNILVKTETA